MEKLAIEGGKPVRDEFISYGRQTITEEDIEAVAETLRSDYLTTGPKVKEFEQTVAHYVGAKYAVAVSNGTAALHVACLAAGIEKGDEVIVTPMTFAASSNCILYCGGIPVFTDIEPETGNIDVDKIEEKINKKTKAIIAVDFTGQSVDSDRIKQIAEKHNIIYIEDGSHALGSEYKGRKVGTNADMTTFSFHPVKPITTAEGGMIVTNDEKLYEKLELHSKHGITRDTSMMTENHGPWYYEQIDLGYNYRLPDLNCALGVSQMKKLDRFISRRKEIVKKYNEAFKDFNLIETPYEHEYSNSGYHLYIIRLNLNMLVADRKQIFEALRAENIGVNVHYLPIYLHPYYKQFGYKPGLCKNSEEYYKRIITLPLFPLMTDEDADDVTKAVKKVLLNYKKN